MSAEKKKETGDASGVEGLKSLPYIDFERAYFEYEAAARGIQVQACMKVEQEYDKFLRARCDVMARTNDQTKVAELYDEYVRFYEENRLKTDRMAEASLRECVKNLQSAWADLDVEFTDTSTLMAIGGIITKVATHAFKSSR